MEKKVIERSLWYQAPAKGFYEALPIGNGSMGAMIYGQTEHEEIPLNLDQLWSGDPQAEEKTYDRVDLAAIQKAIFEQRYKDAEEMIQTKALGEWTQGYLPAGKIHIDYPALKSVKNYKRQLVLNSGIAGCSYDTEDSSIEREIFASSERPVIVYRIHASSKPLKLQIRMDSLLEYKIRDTSDEQELFLTGRAPVYVAPSYYECPDPIRYEQGKGLEYGLLLRVEAEEGRIEKNQDHINVYEGKEIRLIFTGMVGTNGVENMQDLFDILRGHISKASEMSYEALRKEHKKAFENIYERVELSLGEGRTDLPTDVRLEEFQKNREDQDLIALMYQYGRYLLISSSKPGTECANLQGIWNEQMRPPWSSNYTVNINTEMNYWAAESGNLKEYTQPLFELMKRTAKEGEKVASQLYGCRGWVSHHNIDYWGHAAGVGRDANDQNASKYGMWPMSSGWLCRHLWDHYLYTEDKDFLEKEAYPLMKGAVRFYLDFLTPYGEYLVTAPSTSPENTFLTEEKEEHAVSLASTMDISILKELFKNYLDMCSVLGIQEMADEVREALQKLPPFKVGKLGQLQEWFFDYEEMDPNHRHISHLYGVYPGDTIREDKLKEAAKVTLRRRGKEGTGWCLAWRACAWARLGDAAEAYELLCRQLHVSREEQVCMTGGGTYPNLFCAHPPFQIDGNFGMQAAITEMLMQTDGSGVKTMAAIPTQWKTGFVRGLKTPGNKTVSFAWENGNVIGESME